MSAHNARFWFNFRGSYVRITLVPEQVLDLVQGWPTDEGYWRQSIRLEHCGTHVGLSVTTTERDCDGRFSITETAECLISSLASRPDYSDPSILLPRWQWGDSDQRDYRAEEAGY